RRSPPVEDGGRMERGDDRPPVDGERLTADPADRDLLVQDHPRGEVPQGHDDAGADVLDLPREERPAGFDLVGERIPVTGRPALDDVADVDVLAPEADLAQ